MPRRTPIAEVMTAHVHTLPAGAKLSEVRRLLTQQGIHHVPIVDEGVLVGMISSRDLIEVLRDMKITGQESIDELLDRHGNVSQHMSTHLVTLRPDDGVERAIELIADGTIHSLLVVDPDRRLLGIVTDTDLLDFLGG